MAQAYRRGGLAPAPAGAVVASAGDLLLLRVGNAMRPELALPTPPAAPNLAHVVFFALALPALGGSRDG